MTLTGQAELPREEVPRLLPVLRARAAEIVGAAHVHVDDLEQPSGLPGWTRLTIVAHLRYIAEAMHRMTVAALAGAPDAMYPGGRAAARPATLVLRDGESPDSLVKSFAAASTALDDLWSTLSPDEWLLRLDDPDHGPMPLSRLLALRLTENEVHGTYLRLPGIVGDWDSVFIDALLPLRLGWLDMARHRPDAVNMNGTWILDCGTERWRVVADGSAVNVRALTPGDDDATECRIRGSRRDMLAFLLGRAPTQVLDVEGAAALAIAFKRAFPGP